MADTYLSSGAINGGTPVVLRGTRITYKHYNYVKVPDIPARFTYGDTPVTVSFAGWTNPSGILEGVIDAMDDTAHVIDFALLKDFAQETTGVYISDSQYYTGSYTTKIQVQSFNVDRNAKEGGSTGSDKGTFLRYSIDFVETK